MQDWKKKSNLYRQSIKWHILFSPALQNLFLVIVETRRYIKQIRGITITSLYSKK